MKRLVLAIVLFAALPSHALLRLPAISRTHIAFISEGQLWIAPRDGSSPAVRLTSTSTRKFDPRFSPDGQTIAYSDNVAANMIDIFTIPLRGGEATRITHLPSHQGLQQWTRDGRLLFYTNALSFNPIEMQMYAVPARGGLETGLPVTYGSELAIDDSGEWLAYTPQWPNSLMANWKRYRGGMAQDIRLLNLRTHESRRVTTWRGTDARPMWHGRTLYYVSDAGLEQRLNLWRYDLRTRTHRQVTHFAEYDVRFPSIGPDAIIFQYGPELKVLDLARGMTSTLHIDVPATILTRDVDVSRFITRRQLGPGGRIALAEARGDLWIISSSAPRNLTMTSGAFEREAALSPDGKRAAYFSDATGEYQLYVRDLDGEARQLTNFKSGFRYRPVWSSDEQRLAFVDNTGAIFVCDLSTSRVTKIDTDPWMQQPELVWSPDSTWLAYTRSSPNRLGAIWRYDVATGAKRLITAAQFNAGTPVFTRDSLLFISNRDFTAMQYDYFGQRVAYRPTAALMSVSIAAVDFEREAVRIPIGRGAINALAATSGGDPIYSLTDQNGTTNIRRFDLTAKKEEVIGSAAEFDVSPDGRFILLGDAVKELGTTNETKLVTAGMTATIDLRAEWRELFDDAWRLYRDFHYAPQHPHVDWNVVRRSYAVMLATCTSRDDVNYVLSEMIGESSTGHSYVGAQGDVAAPPPAESFGYLGADFAVDSGGIRIARIYEGAPWDETARSPLRVAGVREGEYLLAVNGTPLDAGSDPRAAFRGLAGKPVTLTIGNAAVSRQVTVTPLESERNIRYRAWVDANRRRVDAASGGRIGYIHIPDFSTNGLNEFVRQYYGLVDKGALIIDPRWSQGGWTGAVVAELLARVPLNYNALRDSENVWPAPRQGAHFGPKCLLVNHMVVSAGENFAYYFRKLRLGPIIGARTWGGLTGLNGTPPLIDGGSINVPDAPFFDRSGWLIENHGLDPDVAVNLDPSRPGDPQLEAAIAAMRKAIAAHPYVSPHRPSKRMRP
ncbi:MAG: tricorn protease [Thermoanaerobaculia bacterium]|jgi:tricorn protease|nr:tricorn protease [Thermoanaerobaculia bacterium]